MLGTDKKKAKAGFEDLAKIFKEQKIARYLVYGAGALIVLYVLGKSMSVIAGTVRSYTDLKNAFKS